ncbi:MAG: HD domain-containing protein [Thermoplasmatota archaeon]
MSDYKVIYDPVHGTIKINGVLLDLIGSPELIRLNQIRQLGLSYLVFPGAHHTRFEHSVGTSHVAGLLAREIDLPKSEIDLVSAAGLLHDIGHGPFSHTLERIFKERIGKDHMQITRDLITGEDRIIDRDTVRFEGSGESPEIPVILESHDIDPKMVAELVCQEEISQEGNQERLTVQDGQAYFSTKGYLYQLIHSAIDADQLDFLLRDSRYTGVAYGIIDLDRIIHTITLYHGRIMIHRRGISALEGMLVARSLMYSSVYFHKTARIAESMLVRAGESLSDERLEEIWPLTDGEVLHILGKEEGVPGDIVRRLRYRKLFKSAFRLESEKMAGETPDSEGHRRMIREMARPEERRMLESMICRKASVPEGLVIVDIPDPALTLSEPRLRRTDINVLGDRPEPLSRISNIARALQFRPGIPWCMMVSCPGKYIPEVSGIMDSHYRSMIDIDQST